MSGAPHDPPQEQGITWRGVIARAPARVVLPAGTEHHVRFDIPVRGFYLVGVCDTQRHPGPKAMVLTNLASGEEYRADVLRQGGELLVPPSRSHLVTPASTEAMRSRFNFNVCDYLRLPPQPARYRLHVLFAGYTSNAQEIEVVQHEQPTWPRRWRIWAALRCRAWLRPDAA